MDDCYLKEFKATVASVNNKYIVLDNTAFYPNSGGQPHDTGSLIRVSDGEEFKVIYVAKVDGNISHEVDKEGLKVGDKVVGKIDWERRYLFMRYHTASHILSGLINKETGAEITGNQIAADKTRIDFNIEHFDKETIKGYEREANQIIGEARNVFLKTMSREDTMKIPSIFKLAKGFPDTIKVLRIVEIENFDQQACGGTHLKNTKEIGGIEITKTENKGANNRRLYFVLKS
jgi:misacylated tRNA(Ala) deacylase